MKNPDPNLLEDLNTDRHSVAAWISQSLVRRGVKRVYGLQGGHIQPIWDFLLQDGVQVIDVRDEGAAVHMAHAHAELTGEIGVCFATAGPGVTNCVTGMRARSVLLIGGVADRRLSAAPAGKHAACGESHQGREGAQVKAKVGEDLRLLHNRDLS